MMRRGQRLLAEFYRGSVVGNRPKARGSRAFGLSSYYPVEPGNISPRRAVDGVPKPPYAEVNVEAAGGRDAMSRAAPQMLQYIKETKDEDLEARLRASSGLARDALAFAGSLVAEGVTTDEIDAALHNKIVHDFGAYPSPLNYHGFPKSLCSSVNEVVCHGIPDSRPLQEGDIVNLDVSVFKDGVHGDTSRTFYVGGRDACVENGSARLVETTERCLNESIALCKPGAKFSEIGALIEEVAGSEGYKVIRDYSGHGIGTQFHMLPYVFHYTNSYDTGEMKPGMCFTIEPMLVDEGGTTRCVSWDDGWTVVTADGSRSAQAEHTLLITDDGCDVLTAYEFELS